MKDKKYCKVIDRCHDAGVYRGAVQSICKLRNSVPEKCPIVFHNGSNYDNHYIIKEIVEECKKQFTYLGENTEKYITFIIPIEKGVKIIDKNVEEITKHPS